MDVYAWILTLAIVAGQIVKLPLGQGGVTVLDLAVIFLCLLGLWKLKIRLKKPPLFVNGALLFILIALFSLILTPLHLQPTEYLTSFLYTVRFSVYILLGWIIFSGAFPTLRNNIPRILIFSGLGLAVLGLTQFIFLPDLRFLTEGGWDPHYFRTVSTFLDPNFAGAFMALTLILLVHLRCVGIPPQGWDRLTPKVFYLIFASVYIALLTTFSRSSYGMFLLSFLTLSFLIKSFKLACLTIVLFILLLVSFQIYIQAVNKVTPLDRNQTASFRFSTWQQGFQLFQKSPLLGIGFNAYNFALRQSRLGSEQFLAGKGATTNDSSLLYILSTTGILGFLAYFIYIVGMIRTKKAVLVSGIIGLFAHSIFVNSLFYPFILIWIILFSASKYDKQITR